MNSVNSGSEWPQGKLRKCQIDCGEMSVRKLSWHKEPKELRSASQVAQEQFIVAKQSVPGIRVKCWKEQEDLREQVHD